MKFTLKVFVTLVFLHAQLSLSSFANPLEEAKELANINDNLNDPQVMIERTVTFRRRQEINRQAASLLREDEKALIRDYADYSLRFNNYLNQTHCRYCGYIPI